MMASYGGSKGGGKGKQAKPPGANTTKGPVKTGKAKGKGK